MILNIFKIGGSIVENPELLANFAHKISAIHGPRIIIHGGGSTASKICHNLGIEVKMHNGRRITDLATLKVIIMTYAGLINKEVVAQLQANDVNSVGLCGVDGNTILAHKRHAGDVDPDVDFGFAGDIDVINTEYIISLLQNNLTPVIAPLSHDGKGQLLNTNADTIAAHIAGALATSFQVRLTYLLDHPGVLRDVSDAKSVLAEIKLNEIPSLQEQGIISSGMIPKLKNAAYALDQGVDELILTNVEHLTDTEMGSKIVKA